MRLFLTPSHVEIRVGENAKDNDIIIKQSHQDYLWCHLENSPSPHVVICSREPDPDSIMYACQLVKYYSKFSESGQVNIILSKIRDISRVDPNTPGLVELKKKPIRKTVRTQLPALRDLGLNNE